MPPIIRMRPAMEILPTARYAATVREDTGGVEGASGPTISDVKTKTETIVREMFAPCGDALDDDVNAAVEDLVWRIWALSGPGVWTSDALSVTVTIA